MLNRPASPRQAFRKTRFGQAGIASPGSASGKRLKPGFLLSFLFFFSIKEICVTES
jgi:hypothetical protein